MNNFASTQGFSVPAAGFPWHLQRLNLLKRLGCPTLVATRCQSYIAYSLGGQGEAPSSERGSEGETQESRSEGIRTGYAYRSVRTGYATPELRTPGAPRPLRLPFCSQQETFEREVELSRSTRTGFERVVVGEVSEALWPLGHHRETRAMHW